MSISTSKALGLWAALECEGREGLTPSSALQGTEETPKLTWESTAPPPAWPRQGIAPFGCLMSALSENFAGTIFREEGIGFMASNM